VLCEGSGEAVHCGRAATTSVDHRYPADGGGRARNAE
jgi:hypothetical protein